MTVCIAGICMDRKRPRFVLCSDGRIQTDEAGGDVCLKWDHAGGGWWALLAGDTAKARDLAAVCRRSIASRTEEITDSADFVKQITECAQAQKRTLVENFVQSQLAVNYDYLLKHGASQLPERQFDDLVSGVRSIDLGCQLILVGFLSGNPFMFTIDRNATVYREESFAVIGAGGPVAQSSLFRRAYRGYMPINEAAYYIYEAKRLSEVAPGVGSRTDMAVIGDVDRPGFSKWMTVDPFYMARLDSEYKRFGPQEYKSEPWQWPTVGLWFKEDQPSPELTTDDQSPPPPSLELPERSGES